MSGSSVALVICLTVLGAVGIPLLLYLAARRDGGIRQAEILKKAANAFGNPWKKEDEDLAELARRVDRLGRKSD